MLPVGLLPAVGQSFRVADSVTGLLVTLYAVMVATLAVPLTLATARFARKPLLLTTLLCYALSNALVAVAPSFAVLAAGRAIGGVTHALFFSLCIGYVPRLIRGAQVGRALAIAAGGATAGFVLGVPLSTSLGTALGWRTAFGLLAALSVVTLLLVARLLPSVENDAPVRSAERPGGRGALAAVVSSNALTFLGQFTLYTFVSLLFLHAGARPAFIGPLLLLCGVSGLAGLAYAAGNLDHRPRRTAIVILMVVIAAYRVVADAPTTTPTGVYHGAVGFQRLLREPPGMAVVGCVERNVEPVSPELAGAWVNATANIGIAGGAAIGAALLPLAGLGGLPWVSAALIGLGLSVSLVARRAFPTQVARRPD
jgi:predicted MFS family arabinose efflux permease